MKAFQISVLLWPMWTQKELLKYFEKTLVAIKVKAFQFSFLLWPVWKQINLVEYFEMALGRHSGESLSIFLFLWPVRKQINLLSILKRHFAAIKVKAFKFSVLLWDGMGYTLGMVSPPL